MSNKRIGKRSGRTDDTQQVRGGTGTTDEGSVADAAKIKNDGLAYTGPMDNGGLRLPAFNLTWGKVAGLLATLVTAVIAATATVLTITHGIEGSLAKITDLV